MKYATPPQQTEKPERNKILVDNLPLDRIKVIANYMSNDLFYMFAHTPLSLGENNNITSKLVVCLSNHGFSIEGIGNDNINLSASGLIARDTTSSAQNIIEILDQHPSAVVIVSQLCKRYLDKETIVENYKPRIFSLLPGKKGITNKLPGSHKGNIYRVRI